jgi:hypothetical protein
LTVLAGCNADNENFQPSNVPFPTAGVVSV